MNNRLNKNIFDIFTIFELFPVNVFVKESYFKTWPFLLVISTSNEVIAALLSPKLDIENCAKSSSKRLSRFLLLKVAELVNKQVVNLFVVWSDNLKKSIYEFCSRLGLSFIIDRSSIIGRIIGQKFVGWIEDVWDDSKLKELDQPICRQFSYGPYL